MKKIYKLFLMTAIAFGMVACSNDEVPEAPESLKGNTYASISVKLPKGPSTRAGLPDDYNKIGTWEGMDAIKTITVFLVNETLGTVDSETFTTASFEGVDAQGVLFPKLALKATEGQKVKAYIVLNGTESTILTTLGTTAAGAFDDIFNAVIAEAASKLAKNVDDKDVIMMTNTKAPVEMTVIAGVTESEAMTGSGINTFMVDVERVVSRAIVTAKEAAQTAEISVYAADGITEGSKITIKSLNYVVGQSNSNFYMIKKATYETPAPLYAFVPAAGTWNAAAITTGGMDNDGLTKSSEVKNATGTPLADFTTALTTELANSKFVLPVTHSITPNNNYRKGNTTYFEVTAIFTPSAVADDGIATYSVGDDVFLGMKDGKFYTTRALAEAVGQKATHYKGDGKADGGAIMKYVLWLNPNEIPGVDIAKKATMSPTVRNQVYHAHISGFKQIGLPNNPLNPGDPTDVLNPPSPIKPEDPLQTDDTYLSVQITVLDWGVHSYEINLGNDY